MVHPFNFFIIKPAQRNLQWNNFFDSLNCPNFLRWATQFLIVRRRNLVVWYIAIFSSPSQRTEKTTKNHGRVEDKSRRYLLYFYKQFTCEDVCDYIIRVGKFCNQYKKELFKRQIERVNEMLIIQYLEKNDDDKTSLCLRFCSWIGYNWLQPRRLPSRASLLKVNSTRLPVQGAIMLDFVLLF